MTSIYLNLDARGGLVDIALIEFIQYSQWPRFSKPGVFATVNMLSLKLLGSLISDTDGNP